MDTDRLYRAHILKCVDALKRYTAGKSFRDFAADELLQDAVAREPEILGEAAKRLSDGAKFGAPLRAVNFHTSQY